MLLATQAAKRRRVLWTLTFAVIGVVQSISQFGRLLDSLYLLKWMTVAGFVVSLLWLSRWKLSLRLAPIFLMLVAITLIGLLSQFSAGIDSRAVALAVTFLTTAGTATLLAPSALERAWVRRALWCGLLYGINTGIVLGFVLGLAALPSGIVLGEDRIRYFGLFAHPNTAGTVALTGVVLSGAYAASTRRIWRIAHGIPGAAALVLTGARGAAAAALAFAIVVLALTLWRRVTALRPILLALMVVSVAVASVGLAKTRGISRVDLNEMASGRIDSWSRSLEYLESPLEWTFGLGFSRNYSFVHFWTADFNPGRGSSVGIRGSGTDSTYVDLLTRTGIVGLSLFALALIALAWRAIAYWARGPASSSVECAVAAAAVAAAAVLGLTDSTMFTLGLSFSIAVWPLVGGCPVTAARAVPGPLP